MQKDDKLQVNPKCQLIFEVMGKYPSGQAGYKEDSWKLKYGEEKFLIVPESLLEQLFKPKSSGNGKEEKM